ncbi:MAG: lysophospholipid acyltransferase family protein [Victivallales bacterium]|nr:lysophospholipid acyltransferase family protein [Victivallales bacterium]MCF7888957.1 lysophospholipid acyltransferase family protein [Victivallales bacterium]
MVKKEMSKGLGKGLQKVMPKYLAKIIQPVLFRILAIYQMDKIHDKACRLNVDDNFAEKLFHKNVMNISIDVSKKDMDKVPSDGPLIVVANHPFGGVDGIALLALLKRIRPDVKLMANYILGGIPELKKYFFLVDPFEKTESSRKSIGGIRETLKWLKSGHALGLFPAGEVSTYNKKEDAIVDKEWKKAAGMIVRNGKCSVQCIYIEGHNSKIFQFLGKINPVLRTLWLAREFKRACNSNIRMKIGEIIPAKEIGRYKTPQELMKFLKKETYLLAEK